MANSIEKGDLTVLAVALALAKRGEHILFPFSESERYDLALDRKGMLYRIQCKTGRLRNGAIVFNVASSGPRSPCKTYDDQIEAFGVYCTELNRVFLIPFDDVLEIVTIVTLRVDEPRNFGGSRRIRLATHYEI